MLATDIPSSRLLATHPHAKPVGNVELGLIQLSNVLGADFFGLLSPGAFPLAVAMQARLMVDRNLGFGTPFCSVAVHLD